ncbi:zinc finger protein 69 homolog B [Tribolium castaneum]|uniref:Zinc finger protein 782-like Protein n=1 Tax=Tribolium castaneum TaxID=7070 RepID=D2A2L9_TRICA|nr:PREDICTED: zinc finger protein ZFP69B [Tribolium castaneum]EFA02218.1 Zinc finger protein 782-like Protein [Tribolium castaneum]|eukprot:XP_008191806.1 PREDICTED: zinc finger protein ZFP69B [Tribolium castaneum]
MENVCRTCLRVPDNLTPLYSNQGLIEKIEAISSIQIIRGKEYPSSICQECVLNVNTLYNFRKVIINSDRELKERSLFNERLKPARRNSETAIKTEELKPKLNETVQSENESVCSFDELNPNNVKETVKGAIAVMKMCKCNVCDKTFPSRFKLYNHKRTEHVAPGVCNVCGMIVRSDNLKRHVQLHLETPVECKHCGKVFKNSESLRGHMLIHRGIIYTCEICEKTFKVKAEYKRHLKTHIDPEIGKVMCTICGKRVRDMKKHMHSHTGERPYMCVYCCKGFTSTYSLKVHTRQHTNEKPYVCEHCPMAFPQKVSLVTHIKSKHGVT